MKQGTLKWSLDKEETREWIDAFCDAKGISDDNVPFGWSVALLERRFTDF